MTESKCDSVRDRLRGYRLGEGTPLERLKLENHLEQCAGCNNELWLHFELDRAARMSPAPLSEGQKRSILDSIHAEVGQTPQPTIELRGASFLQRWMLVPAAAAACALLIAIIPSSEPQSTAATVAAVETPDVEDAAVPTDVADKPTAPLEVGPGVVAFTTPRALAHIEKKKKGRRVALSQGELVAEYRRPEGDDPLEIITPHATVIIRGTVFAVRAAKDATTVAVDRGKVEVRTQDGKSTFLSAGQMLRIGMIRQTPEQQPIEADIQSNMQSHFGIQPTPVTLKREEPSNVTKAQGLVRKVAKPKKLLKAPVATRATASELIRSARTLWRQGEYVNAIEAVESVLQGEGLDHLSGADRNDARYLLATIHRDRGDYGKAAALLRLLAAERNAPSARLAKLELARVMARHLGDSPQASELLTQLVEAGVDDLIAEESLFELCALHLKAGAVTQAAACLSEFVERFSESDRIDTARELLRGLAPADDAR